MPEQELGEHLLGALDLVARVRQGAHQVAGRLAPVVGDPHLHDVAHRQHAGEELRVVAVVLAPPVGGRLDHLGDGADDAVDAEGGQLLLQVEAGDPGFVDALRLGVDRSDPFGDGGGVVLERGGRFFGDGVYTSFGGTFYSYNSKTDAFPDIKQGVAVIVDSVINTGKSILDMVDQLKQKNPEIEIIVVSNVIQNDAVNLLQSYKVFAVRTSANSFVGSRQAMQKNGKGPDTADRLFNYID